MMRHFKLPLIVSGVALVVIFLLTIAGFLWLDGQPITNSQKKLRAEKMGSAMGTFYCIVIAPFWLIAAAKFGKERREARKKPSRR